jgi:hypothetical protein
VDVGLDHRGIDPQTPSRHHAAIARDLHHPLVDLFDHRRPQRHTPTAHSLGIRHLGAADPGEVAVDKIGAHLALEHGVAPVAHVLEHQQPQHHLGRGSEPAAAAAPRVPSGEGLVHRRDDLRVVQHPIGLAHPGFVQVANLGRDQPVAETPLCPPPLNHRPAPPLPASSGRSSACEYHALEP